MARVITCECGYVARGESDDQVISDVENHLKSDHPQLAATVTRDQIASWIEVQ